MTPTTANAIRVQNVSPNNNTPKPFHSDWLPSNYDSSIPTESLLLHVDTTDYANDNSPKITKPTKHLSLDTSQMVIAMELAEHVTSINTHTPCISNSMQTISSMQDL